MMLLLGVYEVEPLPPSACAFAPPARAVIVGPRYWSTYTLQFSFTAVWHKAKWKEVLTHFFALTVVK